VPGALFVAPSAGARRRAVRALASANGGIMLGLRAASPARFLPTLEARAGLAEPVLLSAALERLLVEDAARAARVPLFEDRTAAAPSGAIRAIAGLIRSLRMNRVTPDAYAEAGGDRRAAEAYRHFERRRAELGLHDPASRIDRLLERGVPPVSLVLDDPALTHRASFDLYAAAIEAAPSCHVGISIPLPNGGPGAEMAARLEALGLVPERGASDATSSVLKRAIGGAGIYDEVELVAREILARLRSSAPVVDSDSGTSRALRPGDILALAPNSAYLALLHDACTRLGVPVAGKRRVAALDVPLVRALLSALELLTDPGDDRAERGLALLAAPYMGLSLDQHDVLARALTRNGLGAMDSWRRYAAGASTRFRKLADAVPRIMTRLGGERSHRELAGTIAELAIDYHLLGNGREANLAAGCDDIVRIDQQGWNALESALDELGTALRLAGMTRLPARRWLAELREVLAGVYVGADAKPLDGIRLTVIGAGLPTAAHVYAVGWRDGLMPRRSREDPFLTERVKGRLNELGAIFPLAERRVAHEHERRERVVRAARETLTISYPSANADGDPLLPSFYLEDLGLMNEGKVVGEARGAGDVTWPLSLAATRAERVTRATLAARHTPKDSLGGELDAVRSTLAELTGREMRSYDGRRHAPQVIRLRKAARKEAAKLAGVMSASQAKMITHCLYEHFGSRRLRIEQLRAPDVDALILGNVVHAVLAELGRGGFDPDKVDSVLARRWNDALLEALRDEPKAGFEREVLASQLRDLVTAEREYLRGTEVSAVHFELGFGRGVDGNDGGLAIGGLTIGLPPDAPIDSSTLRGSIDRVDVIERHGRRFGVAIDYKTGKGRSYRNEMDEMADFQLPIYCAALPLLEIEPVGAFYLGVSDRKRYGVVREEFADIFAPETKKEVKRLSEEEFDSYMRSRMGALSGEVARLARGELVVRPRKDNCAFCELRPVCRIGTFGGGSGDDDGEA
jgi:RecB family exonuclease